MIFAVEIMLDAVAASLPVKSTMKLAAMVDLKQMAVQPTVNSLFRPFVPVSIVSDTLIIVCKVKCSKQPVKCEQTIEQSCTQSFGVTS